MPPKKKSQEKPLKPAAKINKITAEPVTHEVDADDQILGRLATNVANLLRGKSKTNFVYHQNVGDKVFVYNAAKIRVSGAKLSQKMYYRHSGYIGNLKSETMSEVMRRNPSLVVYSAVSGMLPKNKLRNVWLKNLTIKNGAK